MQRSKAKNRELALVVGGRIVLVGSLLWLWDYVVRTERVSPLLLPAPADVFRRLGELLQTSGLWDALWITVFDVLAAFVVSVVTGVVFGVAVGASRYWSKVTEPLVVAAYTVPIIVIYPVITMLFGIGDTSKIVFAGLYGFFPIAANTIRGLQVVRPGLIEAGRALGASPRQLKWYVLVPAARPLILSGVRIGLSLNLVGVVAAQMLASTHGIGYLISTNAQLLNSEDLYAYILLTFVLAGLINYVLTRQEQRVPSSQSGSRRRSRGGQRPAAAVGTTQSSPLE